VDYVLLRRPIFMLPLGYFSPQNKWTHITYTFYLKNNCLMPTQ
jgi:hypothetical protein